MKNIACIGKKPFCIKENGLALNASFSFFRATDVFLDFLHTTSLLPDVIIFDLTHETADHFMQLRYNMLKHKDHSVIPFIVVSQYPSFQLLQLSRKFQIKDYFIYPSMIAGLQKRINQVLDPSSVMPKTAKTKTDHISRDWEPSNKIPLWKRLFDIVGASFLLLISAPLLLLVALLIKLESRGPVFYISKRAGQGYKVFDFYKFRSMRMDADIRLVDLKDQNQYFSAAAVTENENRENQSADVTELLMMDQGFVSEKKFIEEKEQNNSQTFFKIKNDPRITRIGRLIRSTSIDEMPQLLNVLKGDMSLVGNRPLPLYEAERLTSDEWVYRFAAPAGITGLWQVSKSKEGEEIEEDRKQLDITYAKNYNFLLDCKILLLTLPAAFQRADS